MVAEGLGGDLIHLVVKEPEGDFGDAGGPFVDFDAVHLVDVDAEEFGDVEEALVFVGVERFEEIEFEKAEFAVGDDEEVAAAAGGVEEFEGGEFVVKGGEFFLFRFDGFEFGAEVIEEEGADDFQDVAFGGVVGADLAAFLGLHGGLEEGAEDGGGDFGPLEAGAIEECFALAGGEVGEAEGFLEEFAVDVGEGGEVFGEVGVALVFGGVEDLEEECELWAEVGAVEFGVVLEEEFEGVGLEEFGVFGEEAEEDADEEAFEGVAGEACGFELVVEVGEFFDGLEVGGVFGVELAGLVAGDEGEVADVFVEVGEGELEGVGVVFEVVEGDSGEIGDDDVAGGVVGAVGVGEIVDVVEGLGVGFVEVSAAGFVFGDEGAGPEEVDELGVAVEVFDGFFEGGDEASGAAEDLEEFVPEGLGFGAFAGGFGPVLGEGDGALFNFGKAEGHGRGLSGGVVGEA